ncbi:cell envelope integrity protein TolA [Proteiniphilum sp. X52]|uniref:cell envelope integrity protein TolA n=1 Tax=Proteiniphilum sp. X52 TaxID=2382159 RepID=UPI0011CD8719|nr:cell envelope integrity protein TolA [Proteiniphilum sp. X52]
MDEDNYNKVLSGAKLQKQAKEEADRKAEQERIAFEKLVKQRKEREIELLNIDGVKSNPDNTFTLTNEENPDFSNVVDFKEILDCDDKKFKNYKDEFLATAESNKAYREKLRAEKERLQKEAEERERQLAEERAKAEAERKAIEEKARKEREEHERLLLIEREKQAKLEAERRAEQARIEAERLEAERKSAAEKRAKEEAERRAKNAPDKEKLLVFATELEKLLYNAPELKAEDAVKIMAHIEPIIKDTVTYIRLNSDKL